MRCISLTKDGYEIAQIIDGEAVADVLDYVEYNPKKLVRNPKPSGYRIHEERCHHSRRGSPVPEQLPFRTLRNNLSGTRD